MNSSKRTEAFVKLGTELELLLSTSEHHNRPTLRALLEIIEHARRFNPWFTPSSVRSALAGLAGMLKKDKLENWLKQYELPESPSGKTVAVVMAGNIPAAGFHDMLCVLLAGHTLLAKLSSDDEHLIPALSALLFEIEPGFGERIFFAKGKLQEFQAVIATGSNNTSRYFEYYFSKYPNIIRKNRVSAAVLTGAETEKELEALSTDIFLYFGLGCRNVSKLFVPVGFEPSVFFASMKHWDHLLNHTRYFNNYEYTKALYLINNQPFFDNGFLLLREDSSLFSPLGALHFEYYTDVQQVKDILDENAETLQCVVSPAMSGISSIHFGEAQFPSPGDYADGVDTMRFLLSV